MPINYVALLAAGALCAGCSAPATTPAALTLDDPANPAAPAAPFLRPVNVLETGDTPSTSIPSTAMHMAGGSMPGMNMSGMDMSVSMAGMNHGSMAGMDHGSMAGMQMAQAQAQPSGGAAATGVVNAIDPAKRSMNVTHQPIKALGWPSMTMDFPVAPSVDLNSVKPGDRIGFQLGKADADGNRRIEQITPQPGGAAKPGQARPDHGSMPGMAMPMQPQ